MNMKQAILLALIVTLSTLGVAGYVDEGIIDVSYVSQVPDPVQPGDYMDVRFKVSNLGTEPLAGITVELQPSYPFSLDPGEEAARTIVSLDSLQKGDTSVLLKYKVRVDANAVEGTNQISLRYRIGNGSWVTQGFNLSVQTIAANLGIMSVQTLPAVVGPGEPFELQVKVKNLADSTISDVNLKIDLTLSTVAGTAAATSFDSLPFAPVKSATEKKVRTLKPGEEVLFTYSMIAYSSAASRVYKVPIELSYFDSLGTEFSRNDLIGIVVDVEPDLGVVLESSTFGQVGSQGDVSIKFVNKGLNRIKFLDVKLVPSDQLLPISADEIYIGNIDSDDYETADFTLYVRQTAPEDIAIPIHYEFMDEANHKHTVDTKLALNIAAKKESQQFEKKNGGSTTTLIIVAIVVIVIGLIVYRLVRRRKK
jgi:hypothetical protein